MEKKIFKKAVLFLSFLSIYFSDNFSKKIPNKIVIRKRPNQNKKNDEEKKNNKELTSQTLNNVRDIKLFKKKRYNSYNEIISRWTSKDIVFSCKEYDFFQKHREEIFSFLFLSTLNDAIEKKFKKIYINNPDETSEEKFFTLLNENFNNIKKKLANKKYKESFFFLNKTQKYILNITKYYFGKLNVENIDRKKGILNFFEKTNLDIIVNLIAEYKELAYFAFDIEKFLPLKNVVKKVLKKIFYNILESKKTLFSDFLKNYKKSIYFKIFSLNNENFSSEEKIINKNHNEIFSSMYFASMKNIYIKENGEVLSNQFKKMHKKIIEIIFSISEINFSPKSYGNFYLSNFQQKNFDGIEIYFE